MNNLKQSDLEKCIICEKGIMHENNIQFFRIKIANYIVDTEAARRQHGLEMSMGAAAPLARIMGTDPDIAIGVNETESTICQGCFLTVSLAVAWEASGDNDG